MKSLLNKAKFLYFNKNFNDDAYHYLNLIEKRDGKLSRDLIKICDEYALDTFKHQIYAPWLYVYTAMHKKFKEGWIPDNFFGLELLPKINGDYGKLASMRPLNKRIFQNNSLFPDLIYYVNGGFLNANTLEKIDDKNIKKILFADSHEIVFKKNESAKGKGIHFFKEDNFNLEDLKFSLSDGIFQHKIQQHSFFNNFNSAVATLRVTSFITNKGNCEIKFCDLRLPTGQVTHVYDGSYVRISVNPLTGKLDKNGYLTNWDTIQSHPDNQQSYLGLEIPKYYDVIKEIKKMHLSYPLARIIGWDIIIDSNNNIQILEWNGSHPGIKFAEATSGPVFNSNDFL